MAVSSETVLILPPAPARAVPVKAVRSTLVTSGLALLRERTLFDRYLAGLAAAHRSVIPGLTAGVWLPTEFMLAHYAAWDSLNLSADEIRAIGTAIAARAAESFLGSIKHIASGLGVTPWTALEQYPRFWTRAFDGGGIRISRVGPKEATIAFSEIPFAPSPYFRGSLTALHENALHLFSSKVYVRVVPASVAPTKLELRVAWV
jgi:hypothetical protein